MVSFKPIGAFIVLAWFSTIISAQERRIITTTVRPWSVIKATSADGFLTAVPNNLTYSPDMVFKIFDKPEGLLFESEKYPGSYISCPLNPRRCKTDKVGTHFRILPEGPNKYTIDTDGLD